MPPRFLTPNLIDTLATLTATDEVTGFPVENIQDVRLTKRWKGLLRETIDDCESISGWVASGQASTPTLDNVTFKENANSINMGKTGALAVTALYDKTITSQNGIKRNFYVWIYITDTTELAVATALRIEIRSSSGNFFGITKSRADLVNGWQRIGGLLPDDWAVSGSPDITALDELGVLWFTPLAADTIAHGRLKMDYWYFGTVAIDADLATAQSVTAGIIDGHDILSTDDDIKLFRSDDDITYTEVGEFTHNANAMVLFFTSISHRYWKFTISDTAEVVNTTATREIGRLFLGTYVQPTRGMQLGWRRTLTDMSQTKRAFSGTQFADLRNLFWEVDFKIKHDPESTVTTLRDALADLGIGQALWIALEPIVNPNGPWTLYGRFSRPWSEAEPLNDVFDISFKFAEDL